MIFTVNQKNLEKYKKVELNSIDSLPTEQKDTDTPKNISKKTKQIWIDLEVASTPKYLYWLLVTVILTPIILIIITQLIGRDHSKTGSLIESQTEISSYDESLRSNLYLSSIPKTETFNECAEMAEIILVVNLNTGQTIYAQNEDNEHAIASLTKLMTAYVAYKYYSPDQLLTKVSDHEYYMSELELQSGEYVRADDLITALLVLSANDTAYILADNYEGGYDGFVAAMNEYSDLLDLQATRYLNPTGLDEAGHMSSAQDVTTITAVDTNIDYIMQKMSQKTVTIPVYNKDGELLRYIQGDPYNNYLENRHELVVSGLVDAGKTGYTENAGPCTLSVIKSDRGKILFIVLDAVDRIEATTCLIDKIETGE